MKKEEKQDKGNKSPVIQLLVCRNTVLWKLLGFIHLCIWCTITIFLIFMFGNACGWSILKTDKYVLIISDSLTTQFKPYFYQVLTLKFLSIYRIWVTHLLLLIKNLLDKVKIMYYNTNLFFSCIYYILIKVKIMGSNPTKCNSPFHLFF